MCNSELQSLSLNINSIIDHFTILTPAALSEVNGGCCNLVEWIGDCSCTRFVVCVGEIEWSVFFGFSVLELGIVSFASFGEKGEE